MNRIDICRLILSALQLGTFYGLIRHFCKRNTTHIGCERVRVYSAQGFDFSLYLGKVGIQIFEDFFCRIFSFDNS